MTIEEFKEYFGNGYKFNKATGLSHCNYHNWVSKGRIPYLSQLKLEQLTNGDLKADGEQFYKSKSILER